MKHIQEFLTTMATLRGPNGCPWDRKQDHNSLAGYLLEETHEVLSAIHSGDPVALKEELGDLLLQIVMHCQIASEQGQFDFEDVSKAINKKMIERHPHVFGDETAATAEQVLDKWNERKIKEAKAAGAKSVIDGVPNTMPALLQSLKISEKAAASGFEWEDESQVWKQLESELLEFREAVDGNASRKDIALELGDILFTLVNVARWEELNPEESLLLALDKFKMRFKLMEELSHHALSGLTLDQLEDLWKRAKELAASNSSSLSIAD
jgi:tetrapyrrole methylase family protein/MazG family protein